MNVQVKFWIYKLIDDDSLEVKMGKHLIQLLNLVVM